MSWDKRVEADHKNSIQCNKREERISHGEEGHQMVTTKTKYAGTSPKRNAAIAPQYTSLTDIWHLKKIAKDVGIATTSRQYAVTPVANTKSDRQR